MATDEEWAVQSKIPHEEEPRNWNQSFVDFYFSWVNNFQKTSFLSVQCVEKFADYKKF